MTQIGIDEVGRGPIAGPVAVGVFALKVPLSSLRKDFPSLLRDSKKLTSKQRELWFTQIKVWKKEGKCLYAVSMVKAKTIDQIGLTRSINKALSSALKKLKAHPKKDKIFLDGGLHAPKEYLFQKTIIKGDETVPIISLASIIAKVTRDRHLITLAITYPKYKFEVHKGYGTPEHYKLIKRYEVTVIHRISFLT